MSYWVCSQVGPLSYTLLSSPQVLIDNTQYFAANPDLPPSGVSDMVHMQILNEPEILNNLKLRYSQSQIFTYIGPSLLIMNPYRHIPELLSENKLLEILESRGVAQPNIYSVAMASMLSLEISQKNQAIVISGESGAGKTETTKHCMKFLTYQKVPSKEKSISQKILDCNPILEAFGNAKTVRNDNSSRFGKYVRLLISRKTANMSFGVQGATITSYLLEKSRVIEQAKSERNFHIFYYLLSQKATKYREALHLQGFTIENLAYLNKSECFKVNSIDDNSGFQEVMQSFIDLGFKQQEINEILMVLAGIMLLGNLEFSNHSLSDTEACSIKNREINQLICDLFGLKQEEIEKTMVWKVREVGKQQILSPLSLRDCEGLKDSLAKNLFEKLFLWLVRRLNLTVFPEEIGANSGTSLREVRKSIKIIRKSVMQGETNRNSIGLLDIFGFENFEVNSFEQLCINFTNEKLQQLYVSYIYKSEEAELKAQGFDASYLDFQDNQPVLDLIEKYPISVLDILDESTALNSSNDESLLGSMGKTMGNNPLIKVNLQGQSFMIRHTAKTVAYSIKGFRAKNRDEITREIEELMGKANNIVIREAFAHQDKDLSKNRKFLAGKFKNQIRDLMGELSACEASFVRCLKPNEEKQPGIFNEAFVLLQIRYLGLIDSIRIRQNGYEVRRTYQDFYSKFNDLLIKERKKGLENNLGELKEKVCGYFLENWKQEVEKRTILMGKTKIFMKNESAKKLEAELVKTNQEKAEKLKKIMRQYNIYKFKKKLKFGVKALRTVFRAIIKLQCKRKALKTRRGFLRKKKAIRLIEGMSRVRALSHGWKRFHAQGILSETLRNKTKAFIKILEFKRKRCFKMGFLSFIGILRQNIVHKQKTVRFSQNLRIRQKTGEKIAEDEENFSPIAIKDRKGEIELQIEKPNFEENISRSPGLSRKSILKKSPNKSNITVNEEEKYSADRPQNMNKNLENHKEIPKFSSQPPQIKPRLTRDASIPMGESFSEFPTITEQENPNNDPPYTYHFDSLFTSRDSLMLGNFSSIPKSLDCYLDFGTLDQEFLQTIKSNDFLTKAGELLQPQRNWLRKVTKDKILSHQKKPITKSLQKLQEKYEAISVKIFKIILQYSYELPSSSSNLSHKMQTVLSFVLSKPHEPELIDETYLLLIKQLRNNPSSSSSLRIYRFLGLISSARPPSIRLLFPVLNFLYTRAATLEDDSREEMECLKYSISKLIDGFEKGMRKVVPSDNEMALIEFRKALQVPINFLNGGVLILTIEPYTTGKEVLEILLKKLDKNNLGEYFGLYEVCWRNSTVFSEAYLDPEIFILDRVNAMERLKSSSEESGAPKPRLKFFLRLRLFYKFTEQDLDTMDLLYSQYFSDLAAGTLLVKAEDLLEIMAIVMFGDFGLFDMEKSGKMTLNLERYVPPALLLEKGAKFWFEGLMKQYSFVDLKPGVPVKLRFLRKLQEKGLFFAHHFPGSYAQLKGDDGEQLKPKSQEAWVVIKPLVLQVGVDNTGINTYEFDRILKWGRVDEKSLVIYTNDGLVHIVSSPFISEVEFLIKNYIRIAIKLSNPEFKPKKISS